MEDELIAGKPGHQVRNFFGCHDALFGNCIAVAAVLVKEEDLILGFEFVK